MEELENVQWSTYELPNIPIYETKLPKDILDTLWGYIGKATDRLNHKLAGNIDESLILEDVEDTLLLFLTPVVERYLNTVRVKISDYDKISSELKLESLWVNYQKQHEFNPLHNHFGLISFVIWMKIPTDWKEQHNLPFLEGMKESDRKASDFEFEYCDLLGDIRNHRYQLDKSMEGRMVFFPAGLRHTVYPFYNCEEPRISVAGNVWFKTK